MCGWVSADKDCSRSAGILKKDLAATLKVNKELLIPRKPEQHEFVINQMEILTFNSPEVLAMIENVKQRGWIYMRTDDLLLLSNPVEVRHLRDSTDTNWEAQWAMKVQHVIS